MAFPYENYKETGYDKIQFANGTRAEIESNKSKMNVFEPVIATDEDRLLYLGADGEIKDISVNAEAEIKAELNNKVNKSGDTMTNTLTLSKPDSLVQILNIENGKSFLEASNQTGENVFLGGTGTTWYGHVSGQGIWRNNSDDIGWWGVHKDGTRFLDYNFATNTLNSKGSIALGLNANLSFNKDNNGVGYIMSEQGSNGMFWFNETQSGISTRTIFQVYPSNGPIRFHAPAMFSNQIVTDIHSQCGWPDEVASFLSTYRNNTAGGGLTKLVQGRRAGNNWDAHYGLGAQIDSTVIYSRDIGTGELKVWNFKHDNGDFVSPGNVVSYSDIKLKENLKVIPDALEKIQELNGYTYTRKDTEVEQTGVVAQEVQKVLPQAVTTNTGDDGEETLGVAYGNLVGLLIEGIKELRAEVADLKAQLEVK